MARPADQPELLRLAQRDSAPLPGGPLLVAETEGGIHAALALEDGLVVADPFRRSGHLVALLRRHAALLSRRDLDDRPSRLAGLRGGLRRRAPWPA